MGPKMLNCCRPEQVGTTEYGKMLRRIQILEDGRDPATDTNGWKIEGRKRSSPTRKECKILRNKFELEGLTASQG